MEASHHSSDLDPSSVLGFGSALALLDAADEVGRLLTGTLRSMDLADLQAVVLTAPENEPTQVVGSLGTRALPDAVINELRALGSDLSLDPGGMGSPARQRMHVDAETHPALADAGVRHLSVVRLGTVDSDFGIVVAGRTGDTAPTHIQGSTLQMMAAQASMALHRIRLDRERARKEEALRKSEARYRELYECAPVAYVSTAPDGKIRTVNEQATELLGAPKDALIGRSMPNLCMQTPGETNEEAAQRLRRHLRDGGSLHDEEVQLCRADGEQVWVSLTMRSTDHPDDGAERLVMMIDVTERKQMETALREARDELEERVERRTAKLQQVNERLQEQAERLGALRDIDQAILAAESPSEIASVAVRRARQVVPCQRVSVSVIDRDAGHARVLTTDQDLEADRAVSHLESGAVVPLDDFFLTEALRAGEADIISDLDAIPLSGTAKKIREKGIRSVLALPMMVDGTLVGTLKMGRTRPDAFMEADREVGRELADHLAIALRQVRLLETVQKKREQLATLRDIDQAILAAESPKEIAGEAIRRVQKVVSYESATVTVIDWEEDSAQVLAAENNVLDAPTTLPLDEVYLSDNLRAGQTEVISDEDYEPVPEAQDRMRTMGLRSILCVPMVVEEDVIGVVHVGRTEPNAFSETDWQVGRELADHMAIALRQSRLLEAVQKQRERLEERVQERTEELESFTYSVSHDLRTPLRAIDGYTRILKEEHADQLDEEGRRLLDTVCESTQTMGDLIDDLLTLSRLGRREMNRVCIDVAALAREACDELKRAHPDATEDVTFVCNDLSSAYGDRSMIRQVLTNLLSNAFKFTRDEESPRIEVGAEDRDEDVVYFVRDNGVGFNEAYADKLFGVFERLHDDSAFEGTGVGLAVVDRIIRRHGGEVWGDSTEGKGATLYFTLPKPTATDDE